MRHLAILAVLLGVAFFLVNGKISQRPYGYDEADYMFATSLGPGHNWLDTGSISLARFIEIGRQHGADPTQQGSLSTLARSEADPVVYRHWHGPLYCLWLTIPANLDLDEHAVRAFGLIFPFLTVLVLYFGSLFVLGEKEGQIAAILSSALFLWSPITLETSELAPHMMFVLWYICGLILLAKAAATANRRFYYAAVVCAGLAFSTLEVAFVLVLVLLIFAWWQREALHAGWNLLRNSLAIFIATIVATWPSGLFKLSFVKAYLVMAYLAVFRKGAWGNVTFVQTWEKRLAISPVEWCLIAIALVLFFFSPRRQDQQRARNGALVFLLFGGLMVLATLKVYAEGAHYMTPFFAAIELFAAWVLGSQISRLATPMRIGALAVVGCALIWNAHHRLSGFMLSEDTSAARVLDDVRDRGLSEGSLLIPKIDIPMFHYYFPTMRISGYGSAEELSSETRQNHFDAVLYPDRVWGH